jgi:hypothetical protein
VYPTRAKSGLTPISCHAVLERSACAPFIMERRMECINATSLHRKSGPWGTQHSWAGHVQNDLGSPRPHTFLRAKGCFAKEIAHYFGGAGQSGGERGGVFAAGLGHVGAATAGAAYLLRQRSDDFSCGEAAG